MLKQIYWLNTTLGLTLDTISLIVTQYDSSAITSTITRHGDVYSLDSSVAEAEGHSFIDPMIQAAEMDFFPYLPPEFDVFLTNGTDGKVAENLSIPYPHPFVVIAGVDYRTLLGSMSRSCDFNDLPSFVTFATPYFEVLSKNLGTFAGSVEVNSASLMAWMKSDTAIMSDHPNIGACSIWSSLLGPPGIKIPVSALTATTTTTVIGSSDSTTELPMPSSTFTTTSAARTSSSHLPTAVPTSLGSPSALNGQVDSPSNINTGDSQSSMMPTSRQISTMDREPLPEKTTELPTTGQETDQEIQPSQNSENQVIDSTTEKTASQSDPRADSTASSATLETDSPISLSPSASDAALSYIYEVLRSSSVPKDITNVESDALVTSGISYTQDPPSSSNGDNTWLQTVVTIPSITQSSVSDNLDEITASSHNPTASDTGTATPSQRLEITIADQTYTANSAGNFIIGGTTLMPGAVVTISGEEVATRTDEGITSSTRTIKPEVTSRHHTVAADVDIDNETPTPDAVDPVSGTEEATHTDLVVGSSTESINLGSIIMDGFGTPSPTATVIPTGTSNGTGNGTVTFTGASLLWLPRSNFYWSGVGFCLAWMMVT